MSAPDLSFALKVDGDRLWNDLDALAAISDAPSPAVTRVLFTETDRKARDFVKFLCAEAGLAVREDPIGNLFARWEGRDNSLDGVGTGSHIDAIPDSGRFDGTVGVLGAIEAVRALRRVDFRPERSIEVVMFTSEEPTRFGVGCLGSRALSGALTVDALGALRDSQGRGFDEVRTTDGGCAGALEAVRLTAGRFASFVELHIEQGPILERDQAQIGVVSAIAAPASLRITLEGEGGHAGTVLMPGRKDALCGSAEIILAVEGLAQSSGGAETVATTGVCRVHPGAVNSIPDRVVLEIDIRDIDPHPRDRVIDQIRGTVELVAARRGLRAQVELVNADPPARCSPLVIDAIAESCRRLGLDCQSMVSRAYHDSLFMARIAPTGMIFIPSQHGYSHRPEEYSSPEDVARGASVLALTLAALAS
jgi:N-carbamoyl-L-amino-acid hydrolase